MTQRLNATTPQDAVKELIRLFSVNAFDATALVWDECFRMQGDENFWICPARVQDWISHNTCFG